MTGYFDAFYYLNLGGEGGELCANAGAQPGGPAKDTCRVWFGRCATE